MPRAAQPDQEEFPGRTPPAPTRSAWETLPEGGSGSSVLVTAPLPGSADSIRTTSRIMLLAAACGSIPEQGAPRTGNPRRQWPRAQRHVRLRLARRVRRRRAWELSKPGELGGARELGGAEAKVHNLWDPAGL